MLSRRFPFDQTAPWLISSVAGCYIVARARQLSQAKASGAPWLRFLAQQSDVILILCGGPLVWHFAWRRGVSQRYMQVADGDRAYLSAGVVHQLRQVFTVLLLGLGMLARKAAKGKAAELASLARRLQNTARAGASLLATFDVPPIELVAVAAESYPARLPDNGR
jgi:hypothetical protein